MGDLRDRQEIKSYGLLMICLRIKLITGHLRWLAPTCVIQNRVTCGEGMSVEGLLSLDRLWAYLRAFSWLMIYVWWYSPLWAMWTLGNLVPSYMKKKMSSRGEETIKQLSSMISALFRPQVPALASLRGILLSRNARWNPPFLSMLFFVMVMVTARESTPEH